MSDLLINILFLNVFESSLRSVLRYACFKNSHLQNQTPLFSKLRKPRT